MPLYEYRCLTRRKGFEMPRRMKDADEDLKCPDCRSAEVERLRSTFATSSCGTSGPGKFT
jgi:putative FmdB family regulatory protein